MKNGKWKTENRRSPLLRAILLVFSFCIVHCALCIAVSAQDEPAPPPVRTVTKDEKARLDAKTDIKDRTKLALEMMTTHLVAAEEMRNREDFDSVFRELGGFHGLLDNALAFLLRQNSESGKVLDNFKRLEIGLRNFNPRIEALRRDMPQRYEEYLISLMKYVRDARSRAIDPLFDDSVVRQKKPATYQLITNN